MTTENNVAAQAGDCQHKRLSTTALGAITGTGWKCRDCGVLISDKPAPDAAQAGDEPMPCPFCGSGAHVFGAYNAFAVNCTGCNAYGPSMDRQGAIDGWNKRYVAAGTLTDEGTKVSPRATADVEREKLEKMLRWIESGLMDARRTSINTLQLRRAMLVAEERIREYFATTKPGA